MPGLAVKLAERLEPVLKLRVDLARRFHASAAAPVRTSRTLSLAEFQRLPAAAPAARPRHLLILEAEMGALLPPSLLRRISFERLRELPRYLKALTLRVERAAHHPGQRPRTLTPGRAPRPTAAAELLGKTATVPELRKMAEEISLDGGGVKVSVFAQELGTAFPVSPKRLDESCSVPVHANLSAKVINNLCMQVSGRAGPKNHPAVPLRIDFAATPGIRANLSDAAGSRPRSRNLKRFQAGKESEQAARSGTWAPLRGISPGYSWESGDLRWWM